MKQIKSINSFLAQNVLKLTSFHSFEWASERKGQHFFHISSSQNTCSKTYFGPKFWNSLTFLVFKISLTKLQNSLTFPDLEEKIKFPWLYPDQWPPWLSAQRRLIRLGGCSGWSESLLDAQSYYSILSWRGSFAILPASFEHITLWLNHFY